MNEIDLRLELLRMAKQHVPNGPAEEIAKTAREWLAFVLAEATAPNSSLVKQLTEEPDQLAREPRVPLGNLCNVRSGRRL